MLRKLILGCLALAAVTVAAFTLFVASRQRLRFDVPEPSIRASADPAVIERGRYVVRDLAVCTTCHGDPRQAGAIMSGADVPLSGSNEWILPPGRCFAGNITPDPETGLGSISDGAGARAAVRHRARRPVHRCPGRATSGSRTTT